MKKTQTLQGLFDQIIDLVFLWAIPEKYKPNHFTVIRFILVPVIIILYKLGNYNLAFWVFVAAACTDFIDGALARTRNQITEIGKVIDPIADKLLIGTVLYLVGFQYLIVKVILVAIATEIIAVLTGYFLASHLGKPIGANVFGKIKMILQSTAVVILFFGIFFESPRIIKYSEYTLYFALLFALLAAIKVSEEKLKQWKAEGRTSRPRTEKAEPAR